MLFRSCGFGGWNEDPGGSDTGKWGRVQLDRGLAWGAQSWAAGGSPSRVGAQYPEGLTVSGKSPTTQSV